MRGVLFAVLMMGISPVRADDCSDLDDLMVSRKRLVETVAMWQGHLPEAATACAVFTDLAGKTDRTIAELDRLRARCDAPVFLISSLDHERFLLHKAEERMCRIARSGTLSAAR